jgi:carbonic anhydrase
LLLASTFSFPCCGPQVDHIIVCGHTNCGGIAASTTPEGISSPLENWVAHIGDVYRSHQDELNAIQDTTERLNRLVVLNVVESCQSVYMLNLVQRRLAETAAVNPYPTPRIHGVVYNVGNGELEKVRLRLPA